MTPGLPIELLSLIVSYVDKKKELVSLCMSSRTMHDIAVQNLYKNLRTYCGPAVYTTSELMFLNASNHFKLYQSLQSPSINKLVTDFHISFSLCAGEALEEGPDAPCRCDNFDAMLGRALVELENLRSLHFNCLCSKPQKESRHQYLKRLKAKQLDQLHFWCRCSTFERRSEDPLTFLNSKAMSTVTSLSLDWISFFSPNVFIEEGCLPLLTKLSCEYQSYIQTLLARKTLTHLMAGVTHSLKVPYIFPKISKEIIHLVVSHPASQIPGTNPHSYRNIRHLGRLLIKVTLDMHNDLKMTRDMLTYFPKLHSIEIDFRHILGYEEDSFFQFFSDTGYFQDIEQPRVAPTLKKAYIHTSAGIGDSRHTHWICSSKESGWQLERVPEFTSWDLMIRS